VSDNFDVHLFTEPTRSASQGFLYVVMYKDLDAYPEISFEYRIPSHHRGMVTRIDLKDGHNLSRESPVVRLKMKPINKALTELVRQKRIYPSGIRTHRSDRGSKASENRRPSSKNHQFRRRCYWFKPSKSLERVKESVFQAQKAGQQDRFKKLRNQHHKMLKHEKRQQSFNAYLEETSESKNTKQSTTC